LFAKKFNGDCTRRGTLALFAWLLNSPIEFSVSDEASTKSTRCGNADVLGAESSSNFESFSGEHIHSYITLFSDHVSGKPIMEITQDGRVPFLHLFLKNFIDH